MAPAGTQAFHGEHTAERITIRLLRTRQRFGLLPRILDAEEIAHDNLGDHHLVHVYKKEHKFDVLSLTTDRGSNIAKGAEDNNLFDWHPCVCHILNTAVKDGLEQDASIRQAVEAAKKLSNTIRNSPLAWDLFQKCQRTHIHGQRQEAGEVASDDSHSGTDTKCESELPEVGGERTGACSGTDDDGYLSDRDARPRKQRRILRMSGYNKTRWNSVYYLMKRVIVLEAPIRELTQMREYAACAISETDWVCLKNVVEALRPIKDVSERLEGDSYITISDVLFFLLKLLYDRLAMTPNDALDKPHKFALKWAFKRTMLSIIDNVNIFYTWGMAAFLDGRRSHLDFLRRVWSNRVDWPNVTDLYRNIGAFRNNLEDEVEKLLQHTLKPRSPVVDECEVVESDADAEEDEDNWLDAVSPRTTQRHRSCRRRARRGGVAEEVETALMEWKALSWTPATQEQKAWTAADWWRANGQAHPLMARLARKRLAAQVIARDWEAQYQQDSLPGSAGHSCPVSYVVYYMWTHALRCVLKVAGNSKYQRLPRIDVIPMCMCEGVVRCF